MVAQNRNRYYRSNIPGLIQPNDTKQTIANIIEPDVGDEYFIDWQHRSGKQIEIHGTEATPVCLIEVATELGRTSRKRSKSTFGVDRVLRNKHHVKYIPKTDGKANCLTGAIGPANCFVVQKKGGLGERSLAVRNPTPIECERLQGFPDNRTLVPYEDRMMSKTQRYKQI